MYTQSLEVREMKRYFEHKTFEEVSGDPARLLETYISNNINRLKGCLVRLNILFDWKAFENYEIAMNEINKVVNAYFEDHVPAISLIPQSPAKGSLILELEIADKPELLRFGCLEGVHYVYYSDITANYLYVGGVSADDLEANAAIQSKQVFSTLQNILDWEGFEWSDVIRQWNYIERITGLEEGRQRYQAFNDIRAKYYDTANWDDGYPAATGIGMDKGGVLVDLIAVKKLLNIENKMIYPIPNPLQVDAHHYSQNVLLGRLDKELEIKKTPKFERAKALYTESSHEVFISGTAAILGENTVSSDQADEQTLTTVKNIEALISIENIKKKGVPALFTPALQSIRIYIKNKEDYESISRVVKYKYPYLLQTYVIADVCREELLVEIEGIARLLM
ncbi:chorismate transformation enzyme, FkbO/Hyg5 family [Aureibacter tunicatorum]|uniref:Enamine deaminase RidA (YjgF/YER057c/UK114 family) n=1 Tax=Aureibacter tunicatorum TaxID=866807 RepID=A0AAE3XTM0_9BACT|nr:hypothetical protein [Aureibacter tunicatorum]MDR6241785.1 enamine deaminase RidA (YjgF/YER057c/UK114 family) [Aureibacter tunicatorum]BDD07423.1 PTS cellobiose transporter subunit IIC [Aureibacter tunicatorum]